MIQLLPLILCVIPFEDSIVDYVDEIEINHYFNGWGWSKQIIFRRWSKKTSYHEIIAWRMLRDKTMTPRLNQKTGLYVMRWFDMHNGGHYRTVYAKTLCNSVSDFDIENAERSRFPVDQRHELSKPLPKMSSQISVKLPELMEIEFPQQP